MLMFDDRIVQAFPNSFYSRKRHKKRPKNEIGEIRTLLKIKIKTTVHRLVKLTQPLLKIKKTTTVHQLRIYY
jgi:hypothetical protein